MASIESARAERLRQRVKGLVRTAPSIWALRRSVNELRTRYPGYGVFQVWVYRLQTKIRFEIIDGQGSQFGKKQYMHINRRIAGTVRGW